MRHFAPFLVTLVLFTPLSASALTVAEYLAENNSVKTGFLIGAVDMAVLITPPENSACILKWLETDPSAASQEFFDAVKTANPKFNAAGVLIEIIRKRCGIGGLSYPRR